MWATNLRTVWYGYSNFHVLNFCTPPGLYTTTVTASIWQLMVRESTCWLKCLFNKTMFYSWGNRVSSIITMRSSNVVKLCPLSIFSSHTEDSVVFYKCPIFKPLSLPDSWCKRTNITVWILDICKATLSIFYGWRVLRWDEIVPDENKKQPGF